MSLNIIEKSYSVESRFANFYAGGDVSWSKDGKWIYCLNGSEVTKVDVANGLVSRTYGLNCNEKQEKALCDWNEEMDDEMYCFDISPTHEFMISAYRSSLMRLWHLSAGKVVKLWKSQHRGHVVKVVFNTNGLLICSSGTDSTLRVWDYEQCKCLAVLRDFTGPSVLLRFHPNPGKSEIFAAGSDNCIYKWNFDKKTLIGKMKGHLSQVTEFAFADTIRDCEYLASVGRDKVLIIWNLLNDKQLKVIPMYDELVGVVYKDPETIIVAGSKGNLKLVSKTAEILTLMEYQEGEYEITKLMVNNLNQQLAFVTADHNIMMFKIEGEGKVKCFKQLIGFNDEILDICLLGKSEEYLAMATNSKHIKLYDIDNYMNCNVVMGHKDTVMSLATPGSSNLLLSAGKDFTICLWQLDKQNSNLVLLAKSVNSHAATIGCISFAYNCSNSFASVCQSGSLKVWYLERMSKHDEDYKFFLKYAVVAHDKEVNCVVFSPNNCIIATASQDKTAKLWSADTHSILGSLKGHTRGVWCVRFSPTDQIVLTTSSDCSLRLWSLTNLSCLKRFEQSATVLRAEFIDHGKYILCSAADGLLKLWNIKTNTCIQTLDEHDDRVWSLAVSSKSQKYFFSAAADSKLIKWKDLTEECNSSEIDKRQNMLQQEQTLQLLLHENVQVQDAFILALKLGKPKASYDILNQHVRHRDFSSIKKMVSSLKDDAKFTLLDHVKVWSCNSRNSQTSSVVLQQLLMEMLMDAKIQRTLNIKNTVEVVTPYVQRHFKRITELSKELNFLDFIVESI